MTTQCVQVKLELGHRANLKPKPTSDGFTHDWTVFVRGPEGNSIQHFVEKVVFLLHESFHKPKRVVKEHPYQVSESGYAGFNLQIEVYFKNKEEPKKVVYTYDLFLLGDKPTSYFRIEQLTFLNPTEDFRRRLIKAGGVGIIQSEDGTLLNPLQRPSPRPSTPTSLTHSKPTKHVSDAVKAPKSTSTSANTVLGPTTNVSSVPTKSEIKTTGQLHPQQSFVDLFGQPIKPNKASPEPHKVKESHLKGSSKLSRSAHSVSISSEPTPVNCIGVKDIKSSSHKEGKDSKDSKTSSRDKRSSDASSHSSLKRPISPLLSPISDPIKKKKVVAVAPFPLSENLKQKDFTGPASCGKEKRKSEKKSSSRDKERKEKTDKHKHSNSSNNNNNGDCSISSNNSTNVSVDRKAHTELSGGSNNSRESSHGSSKSARKHKGLSLPSSHQSKSNGIVGNEMEELARSSSSAAVAGVLAPPPPPPPPSQSPVQSFDDVEDASPSSSISFSSVHHSSRGNGPLNALMAELDEQGDDKLLTPLSSDSASSRSPSPVVKDQVVVPTKGLSSRHLAGQPQPAPPPSHPPHPIVPSATVVQQPVASKQLPPSISVVMSTPPQTDKTERANVKEEKRVSKSESRSSLSVEVKEKKSKKSHSSHHKSEKSGSKSANDGGGGSEATINRRHAKSAGKEVDSKHSSSGAFDLGAADGQQQQRHSNSLPEGGITTEYISELRDLQRQIMSLRDRKHLQQIVNVIEETGLYQVTSTTFDFDLCTLDHGTVKKLQNCLAAVV